MKPVYVKARYSCGTYLAATGRGRTRVAASCTMGGEPAAMRCAEKAFRLCRVSNPQRVAVRLVERVGEVDLYECTLTESES